MWKFAILFPLHALSLCQQLNEKSLLFTISCHFSLSSFISFDYSPRISRWCELIVSIFSEHVDNTNQQLLSKFLTMHFLIVSIMCNSNHRSLPFLLAFARTTTRVTTVPISRANDSTWQNWWPKEKLWCIRKSSAVTLFFLSQVHIKSLDTFETFSKHCSNYCSTIGKVSDWFIAYDRNCEQK